MPNVPQSRRLIDLNRAADTRSWMRHFGVSREKLAAAIDKVGPSAAAVGKELISQTFVKALLHRRDRRLVCRFEPPYLKSCVADRFFDDVTVESVRRILSRRKSTCRTPRRELLWQFRADKIVGESAKVWAGLRLENKNPHGAVLTGKVVVVGCFAHAEPVLPPLEKTAATTAAVPSSEEAIQHACAWPRYISSIFATAIFPERESVWVSKETS